MTNKEIAKAIVRLTNQHENGMDDDAFALSTLICTLNSPTKYSGKACYTQEDLEAAVMGLLEEVRFNGVHFMDLSEPMHKSQGKRK